MYYVEEIQMEKAIDLLEKCGLSEPKGVDYTAGVFNDSGKLVATGSLKGDMIQGIAVDPDFQGEDLTAKVFTHLIQKTEEDSLYLFTKPLKVQQFVGLGMRHVATARPYAALLEWGAEGVKTFQEKLAKLAGGEASCLVMNCNPFTKGHRWLIEKAAAESKKVFVFVVEENASLFSYEDRIEMVKRGTADLENVVVLGGGRYMVSAVTFPSYFTKEEDLAKAHTAMDAEIFATCIAPVLNVNRRYVGTEPNSPVTAAYNEALKKRLPRAGVEVVEVPRLEAEGEVVSASKVRGLLYRLLKKDDMCSSVEGGDACDSVENVDMCCSAENLDMCSFAENRRNAANFVEGKDKCSSDEAKDLRSSVENVDMCSSAENRRNATNSVENVEACSSIGNGDACSSVVICQKLSEILPLTTLEYIMSPEIEAKLCRALNYGEARWK